MVDRSKDSITFLLANKRGFPLRFHFDVNNLNKKNKLLKFSFSIYIKITVQYYIQDISDIHPAETDFVWLINCDIDCMEKVDENHSSEGQYKMTSWVYQQMTSRSSFLQLLKCVTSIFITSNYHIIY